MKLLIQAFCLTALLAICFGEECWQNQLVITTRNGGFSFYFNTCFNFEEYDVKGNYSIQSVNESPYDSYELRFGEQLCSTDAGDNTYFRNRAMTYDNDGTVRTYAWTYAPTYANFYPKTRIGCRNSMADCEIYVQYICMSAVSRKTGEIFPIPVNNLIQVEEKGEEEEEREY